MKRHEGTKARRHEGANNLFDLSCIRLFSPFFPFSLFLFAFSLYYLVGCRLDPTDEPEPDRVVVLNFTARPLSGSLLKAKATDEEDFIENILLYGVNNKDTVVYTYSISTNQSLSGISLVIPRKVKSLYAIANPTSDIEEKEPLSVSDLMDLICDYSEAPQSPFLMSGMAEISAIINLELVRAIAKIEIAGDDFIIESVTVINTPAKGYIFSRKPLSVPTFDRITYSYSGNSAIYIAESNGQNPISLFVRGYYHGIFTAYTIVITDGGVPVDIARNTYYPVNISQNTQ